MRGRSSIRTVLAASLLGLPLVSGCYEDAEAPRVRDLNETPGGGGTMSPATPPSASGIDGRSPGTGSGVGTGSDLGADKGPGTPRTGSGGEPGEVSGAGEPSGGLKNDTGSNGTAGSAADPPSSANGTQPRGSGEAESVPPAAKSDPGGATPK
jgi:hypothetical protein